MGQTFEIDGSTYTEEELIDILREQIPGLKSIRTLLMLLSNSVVIIKKVKSSFMLPRTMKI